MKIIPAALLLSLFASSTAFAVGNVEVFTADSKEPVKLTGAERLVDLVAQPRLAESWWPGAVIAERQATAVAEKQHQALLAQLGSLAAEEGGDDGAAIQALRRQLEAIKVTGRQLVPLDPDVVRVRPRTNPPLQGEYTLWVGPQPSTVTVVGLITGPGKKPFTPGRDVADYLDEMDLLSGAERSYAWVVYPDGRTQKVPVAYWNKRHVEPMPGSVIFVGFGDSLWTNKWEALNADILHSLTHRIPD
ncbi:MAG TPA: capsule biosynthesis GfcC D2 domain-containing protein [Enterobacteriaceae bacterium]|nr:capsule biosynthesis GfcC D2 domain-containing protein [Enterobacteriaceae bacterium]